MRVIDADKLLEKWDELSVRGRTEFDQVIMSMPIAYDIDEVITQLRSLKQYDNKYDSYYDRSMHMMTDFQNETVNRTIDKVVDIVKAGEKNE